MEYIEVTQTEDKLIIKCPYMRKDEISHLKPIWKPRFKCFVLNKDIINYKELIEIKKIRVHNSVITHFKKITEGIDKMKDYEYSYKIKPYPHQRELTNLVLNKKRCFFLCEVGTGKTKPAIDAIVELYAQKKVKKCLVVCPASLLKNWEAEIKDHSFYRATLIYGTVEARIKALETSKTLFDVINYDILHKFQKVISYLNYDAVIFDEVHMTKSLSSDRSMASFEMTKDIEYRVGLTGTLIANSPADAYMPYKIISPHIFGTNNAKFKNRYLRMEKKFRYDNNGELKQYEVIADVKNKDEFKALLRSNSLVFKLDDVADIPPIIEKTYTFDLTNKTRAIYKKIKKEFIIEYEQKKKNTFNILERMMKFAQLSSGFLKIEEEIHDVSGEKMKLLIEIIESISSEKIIIFCRFTHSIDKIAAMLKKKKESYYIYDGRTKDKGLYKTYNNDNTRFWITQIKTGIGYSIPSAKYAIYYEYDSSFITFTQTKGRNRRLEGSEEGSCVYIYLQANNTIEKDIYKSLEFKDLQAQDIYAMIKKEDSE